MSVEPNPYGASPHAPPPNAASLSGSTRSVTVRRLDPLSAAKVLGALYALVGLIFGAFATLMALAGVAAGGGDGLVGGLIGGIGAIIMFPIFYGIAGLIGGLIGAALYNVVAGLVGGFVMDLDV